MDVGKRPGASRRRVGIFFGGFRVSRVAIFVFGLPVFIILQWRFSVFFFLSLYRGFALVVSWGRDGGGRTERLIMSGDDNDGVNSSAFQCFSSFRWRKEGGWDGAFERLNEGYPGLWDGRNGIAAAGLS